MFCSFNGASYGKKRRFLHLETEDMWLFQDPDVNPMLKKTKIFNEKMHNLNTGSFGMENNFSFNFTQMCEPTNNIFGNLSSINWNGLSQSNGHMNTIMCAEVPKKAFIEIKQDKEEAKR